MKTAATATIMVYMTTLRYYSVVAEECTEADWSGMYALFNDSSTFMANANICAQDTHAVFTQGMDNEPGQWSDVNMAMCQNEACQAVMQAYMDFVWPDCTIPGTNGLNLQQQFGSDVVEAQWQITCGEFQRNDVSPLAYGLGCMVFLTGLAILVL